MSRIKQENPLDRIEHRIDRFIDELVKLKAEIADMKPKSGPMRSRRTKFQNPTTGETFRPSR
jgi:hypothetical protein